MGRYAQIESVDNECSPATMAREKRILGMYLFNPFVLPEINNPLWRLNSSLEIHLFYASFIF